MNWIKDKDNRHRVLERAIIMSLAMQVKALREDRDMTQLQFAEFTGLTQSTISRLEDPDKLTTIQMGTLQAIAHACDVGLLVRFTDWQQFINHYYSFLPIEGYQQEAVDALAKAETK